MNINLRQIIFIIVGAFLLSAIRYLLLDEYDLIKQDRFSESKLMSESNDLMSFINNVNSPQLVDIKVAKLLYENDLVTFLDARDVDSFNEIHVKGALNFPYDYIDDIVSEYDLLYYFELGDDFIEKIDIENSNSLFVGIKDESIFISPFSAIEHNVNKKQNRFLIYCSGEGCSLSEDLGFYLFEELAISKIFIYEGGISEWINNNLPVE